MRPCDTAITPQRLSLLRQIRDASSGDNVKPPPLYLDDLSAFARLKMIKFDGEGKLVLTDHGARALAS
jgi:hypothetical protein